MAGGCGVEGEKRQTGSYRDNFPKQSLAKAIMSSLSRDILLPLGLQPRTISRSSHQYTFTLKILLNYIYQSRHDIYKISVGSTTTQFLSAVTSLPFAICS